MEIKKLDKSQVEITGEIPSDEFASFWKKALANLSQGLKIDGFRPGHVPEDILIKNVGEVAVLDTAAELALQANYSKIVADNKIEVIGRPMVSITKIAKGNPLGFKIVTAVIPEIALPDYMGIAKKVFEENAGKDIEVTEKEVDDLLEDVRRRVHADEKIGGPTSDDEFVKKLGNFANLTDFREKMQKNLKLEKEAQVLEMARLKAVEAIDAKSQMELPEILVENELRKSIAKIKDEVEQQGTKFEEYLKSVKKTLEDIKKDSRDKAEKSVRYNLILKNIAKKESITVSTEEVAKEAERLVKMYNGADLESAKVYVEDILINNKVLQFLEKGIKLS